MLDGPDLGPHGSCFGTSEISVASSGALTRRRTQYSVLVLNPKDSVQFPSALDDFGHR